MRYKTTNNKITLDTAHGIQKIPTSILNLAICDALVSTNENMIIITKSGIAKVIRHLCDCDPYANQHRVLGSATIELQSQNQQITINRAESPLARLFARKQKGGSRFFTPAQYEAGERLRRDFEKAQMQPSTTARWQEGTSTGNTARAGSGSRDMSDFAIDARARLENSLAAIGPELSGVTLDICCYLKGFELVERERAWPGRSAKLMLKTALAALARHYGFVTPVAAPKRNSTISQWGTGDYRPQVFSD